jgi:hypothetical protein
MPNTIVANYCYSLFKVSSIVYGNDLSICNFVPLAPDIMIRTLALNYIVVKLQVGLVKFQSTLRIES